MGALGLRIVAYWGPRRGDQNQPADHVLRQLGRIAGTQPLMANWLISAPIADSEQPQGQVDAIEEPGDSITINISNAPEPDTTNPPVAVKDLGELGTLYFFRE